jgi:hypothetical protein
LRPVGLAFIRRALGDGFLGRLGALLERALLLPFHNGWWHGERHRDSRRGLALLALRYGKELSDSLVEASELLDELRILREELCELAAKRGILSSQ